MSVTLKTMLRHWTEPLKEVTDMPFNGEEFCRELDDVLMRLVVAVNSGLHHMPKDADVFNTFRNLAKDALSRYEKLELASKKESK